MQCHCSMPRSLPTRSPRCRHRSSRPDWRSSSRSRSVLQTQNWSSRHRTTRAQKTPWRRNRKAKSEWGETAPSLSRQFGDARDALSRGFAEARVPRHLQPSTRLRRTYIWAKSRMRAGVAASRPSWWHAPRIARCATPRRNHVWQERASERERAMAIVSIRPTWNATA